MTHDEITFSVLDELSHTLWRQRRLLETLQFKLEVEQMLLAAARTRWLELATKEVELVLEQIRTEELARAAHLRRVAVVLELGGEPSLAEVVDACPPPWDEIFRDHQAMLLTAVAAVEDAASTNRALLRKGLADTQQFLRSVHGEPQPEGYSRSGAVRTREIGPAIFDSDA